MGSPGLIVYGGAHTKSTAGRPGQIRTCPLAAPGWNTSRTDCLRGDSISFVAGPGWSHRRTDSRLRGSGHHGDRRCGVGLRGRPGYGGHCRRFGFFPSAAALSRTRPVRKYYPGPGIPQHRAILRAVRTTGGGCRRPGHVFADARDHCRHRLGRFGAGGKRLFPVRPAALPRATGYLGCFGNNRQPVQFDGYGPCFQPQPVCPHHWASRHRRRRSDSCQAGSGAPGSENSAAFAESIARVEPGKPASYSQPPSAAAGDRVANTDASALANTSGHRCWWSGGRPWVSTHTHTNTDPYFHMDTDTDTDADSHFHADAKTNGGTDANTHIDAKTNGGTHADADPNAYTNGGTNANADTDPNAYTHADADPTPTPTAVPTPTLTPIPTAVPAPTPTPTPIPTPTRTPIPTAVPTPTPTPTPTATAAPTPEATLTPTPVPGGRMAFQSDRTGNFEIMTMDLDGHNPANLTNGPASDLDPSWCGSDALAFASGRDGNLNIYIMSPGGGNQTRLTDGPAADYSPACSPSGNQIAYASAGEGNDEIYVTGPKSPSFRTATATRRST